MYAVAPTLNQKMSRLKMGSRKNCCERKKFSFKKYPIQSNTPFSGHLWQSIPLSCWTSLRNLNVMKKTETAVKLLRRKINVLSNIYQSKVSTSTSGYLWQSMPQSSCINYKHVDVSKKTGCTEFFFEAKK